MAVVVIAVAAAVGQGALARVEERRRCLLRFKLVGCPHRNIRRRCWCWWGCWRCLHCWCCCCCCCALTFALLLFVCCFYFVLRFVVLRSDACAKKQHEANKVERLHV